MPALLACADVALARAANGEMLAQSASLRDAGVNVLWLAPGDLPAAGFSSVADAQQMNAAWEREQTPAVAAPPRDAAAAVPAWIAAQIAAGEFDRILVLAAGEVFAPAETALARSLLAAGAEAVELLPIAGLGELSQSWISGRRAAACLIG
jgi:hypothetical protein